MAVTSAGTITVSGTDASAIYAGVGITGTINNSGTLAAANGYGVKLHWGGSVTNGSTASTTALISGGVYGVRFDAHNPWHAQQFRHGSAAPTSPSSGSPPPP